MDLSKKKTLVIKNINDSSLTPKDLKWISKELKININELLVLMSIIFCHKSGINLCHKSGITNAPHLYHQTA